MMVTIIYFKVKVIGMTMRHMDMALIFTLMEQNMKDNGRKINKTDMVRKHGLMVHVTREIINKVKSLVTESLNGLMDLNMMAYSLKIISREKVRN